MKNTLKSLKKAKDISKIAKGKGVFMADGGLLAPNGKKSNLTPEQYKLVRTPEFKAWFGDWENDPQNASKVVDENGEPMVCYHRTDNKFTIFDKEKLGQTSGWETAYFGFYFSNKNQRGSYGKKIIKCFLSIKNPYFIETETYSDFDYEYKRFDPSNFNNNDGIFIQVQRLVFDEKADKHFVAFEPNQIKLADGTNTTFDVNNPDIRYEEGGSTKSKFYDGLYIGSDGTYRKSNNFKEGGNMELSIESKLSVSDIDHKYPNLPHYYINQQLIKGIKVEMEHTDNVEVARKIALDHLLENPFYYEYLDKMEEELKSLDIDKHFQELQTENYYARGGSLEAYEFNTPTRIESKLSYIQQVLVRTKAFKNWFGDWELAARTYLLDNKQNFNKHYEKVSKVIDMETLEPKVGYHGTKEEEEFYSFATNKETGAGRPYGYFAENREYSMNFVGRSNLLYAAFLNIRNPFIARGNNFSERKMDWVDVSVAILGRMAMDKFPFGGLEYNQELVRLTEVHKSQIWDYLKKTYENENYNFWLLMARDFKSEFKNFLISHGYDGIFADEQFKDPYDRKDPSQFTNTFIVFDASQVKLADGRNLKFDPMSADIRYEKGGAISWDEYVKTQFNEEENRYLPNDYFEKFKIEEVDLINYPTLLKNVDGLEYRKWKYGGIGVFDGNKKVAFADNGSIQVAEEYQKRGIGLELVTLLKEMNPNHKFGNMTPQGWNLMRSYYEKKIANRYEKGAQLDMPYQEESAPQVLSKGGKMRALLLEHKYKSGGALHNDEGVKDDAKEGGLFVGRSHADGGIKAYNVSTQQPIEVEGGEVIITKKAVDDNEKREFEGEMLTNKEILSRINESGGGVSFADGGEIHGCGCSGKKYNYGGETLEDYMIIKKMNDAYDMSLGKSVSYANSLMNKLK